MTIVPSCAFISPCRPRCGKSSPCARITRNTRVRETRIRSRIRSRAWTLRWPSPWNGERARSLANGRQKLRIRQCGRRPAARRAITPLWAPQTSPPRVERRARPLPRSTHPLETVAPSRRRGGRSAHRRDLRVAKGRRHSAARARSRNSSISIDSSPMWRLAASSSAASGSPACAFRPSSRPASARACHASQAIELYPDFTRDRVQRLAAQQPQNHVPFPARAPPLPGRQGSRPTAAPSAPTPVALRPPSVRADTAPCTLFD